MQVVEDTKSGKKPLSARAIESMKSGDKIKFDMGENAGLWVKCENNGVTSFFYRYTSPITGKLVQVKIGSHPITTLAAT